MTQPQKDKIKISLGEIQNNVSEQTALNKLLLAGFYEEHHLYIDAVAAYEDAIRLAPDVAFYKESYDDFLIRNGMKR
jgi:cytochrome c-type biogenesis protein CcmH/NrfG